MNLVVLSGRLGKDPEVKNTANGKKVVTFSLAVNRRTKNGQETDWFNCTAFDPVGEIIRTYVKKGNQIQVVGSMQSRSWNDDDGQKHTIYFVLVDRVELLGSKTDSKPDEESGDVPFEV